MHGRKHYLNHTQNELRVNIAGRVGNISFYKPEKRQLLAPTAAMYNRNMGSAYPRSHVSLIYIKKGASGVASGVTCGG